MRLLASYVNEVTEDYCIECAPCDRDREFLSVHTLPHPYSCGPKQKCEDIDLNMYVVEWGVV